MRWWPNSILNSVISRETITCTQLLIDLSFCPSQFCFCHLFYCLFQNYFTSKKLTVQPFRCFRSSEAFTTAGSFVRNLKVGPIRRLRTIGAQLVDSVAFWHDQVTCWTYQDNSPKKAVIFFDTYVEGNLEKIQLKSRFECHGSKVFSPFVRWTVQSVSLKRSHFISRQTFDFFECRISSILTRTWM